MFKLIKRMTAIALLGIVAACGSDGGEDRNLVELAQGDSRFSILVEAVVAADLDETLANLGPFTVLAPTDDAFAALLGELGVTREQLLADKSLLVEVLTYHMVPGEVLRADVPIGAPITTVQGDTFTVDANLVITDQRNRGARIVDTDLRARNGVIHAIDRVILPAP